MYKQGLCFDYNESLVIYRHKKLMLYSSFGIEKVGKNFFLQRGNSEGLTASSLVLVRTSILLKK